MKDTECREFLDWALPRMGFRRAGFQRVRGQVCKRVGRRLHELGLPDPGAYRRLLATEPGEWSKLDSFCRITISRFCRDRQVFEWLKQTALPDLAGRALATVACTAGKRLSVKAVLKGAAGDTGLIHDEIPVLPCPDNSFRNNNGHHRHQQVCHSFYEKPV